MPSLVHPHALPHALRPDLLPDPIARTGTPLSRSASPSPRDPATTAAGGGGPTGHPASAPPSTSASHHHQAHPHPQQQQQLHHPLPQLYPAHAHANVLPPVPTFLNAAAPSRQPPSPASAMSSGPTSPSPPTTPTPYSSAGGARSSQLPPSLAGTVDASPVEIGLRGTDDREGVHQGSDGKAGVDGLAYAPGWVDSHEVLDVKGATKVRAISADDFAQLEQQHLALDVPETTLFPWLHGMGDGNRMLDDFFSSFPGYRAQIPAPRYRGLTVLLAAGPGDSRPPSSTGGPSRASGDGLRSLFDRREDDDETASRKRGGSLASDFSSLGSETSWGYSEASSFPTSISSFSSISTAASSSCAPPAGSTSGATTIPPAANAAGAVDASTGSIGLNPAPLAAYTPPASPPTASNGTHSLLTSAVPAEEIVTLTAHASRRVGASPAQPGRRASTASTGTNAGPADDRVTGEELAKMPLGRKGVVRGVFRKRDVGEGTISLRNLSVQPKKYATISDIVVYHPQGFCCSALNVAERVAEAVEATFEERRRALEGAVDQDGDPIEPVRYNVFLVTEPFSAFEERHPELVAVDKNGHPQQKIDLFDKERHENSELTCAREVSPGFIMGNSTDCPVLNSVGREGLDGDDGMGGENRLGIDVCIEAFDDAEMPDPARLRHASQYLASLSPPSSRQTSSAPSIKQADQLTDAAASLALRSPDHKASFSLPPTPRPEVDDATMSDPGSPSPTHKPRAGQIYHLQCISTSLVVQPGDWRALNGLAGRVVDFVKWLKATVDDGRRVLVHGYDGYTETSIFALSYIMHAHALTLPEAYLHLHLVAGRSFFVYPHDLPLLRRIEDRIATDARALASPAPSVQAQHSPGAASSSSSSTSSSIGSGSQKWKSMLGGWKLGHYGEGSAAAMASRAEQERREREERELERRRSHDVWFNSPCFEGSLPSRILDFLYLGNLNHASNPAMLHALGITHVVSVGESALLDPACRDATPAGTFGGGGGGAASASPNHDLWYEHQAGRIKVLDMQSICDDGVSPLRPCIALAVEWMERARREGGKILVHCKVGVSRSATVTIAYLMKHSGYTLIDAYMLCRARRLNVLIQPNLKFMFELQGWEVELSREKAELEHGVRMTRKANGEAVPEGPRQHGTKALSWPIMAKEMAILNHRYLGGSLS